MAIFRCSASHSHLFSKAEFELMRHFINIASSCFPRAASSFPRAAASSACGRAWVRARACIYTTRLCVHMITMNQIHQEICFPCFCMFSCFFYLDYLIMPAGCAACHRIGIFDSIYCARNSRYWWDGVNEILVRRV